MLDEPTTNLDATTEAGILDLLEAIKSRGRTAMIYISHNLGVIARIADRVAVMYAGGFVETGAARAIFHAPSHPYTQALLACLPRPGITKRQASLQSGPVVAATARRLDGGCHFAIVATHRTAACEIVARSGRRIGGRTRCAAGMRAPSRRRHCGATSRRRWCSRAAISCSTSRGLDKSFPGGSGARS